MKNVLTPLVKSVLVSLGLIAAASATDAAIQKNIFGSGTTLVFSNQEIDDVMKVAKSLEDAGFLIKGISEIIENEVKEQKGEFPGMLASALGASLLRDMLGVKGVLKGGDGVIQAGEGVSRAGEIFNATSSLN